MGLIGKQEKDDEVTWDENQNKCLKAAFNSLNPESS
jgi:hypothetical protein